MARKPTHGGATRGRRTPEYLAWSNMMNRCYRDHRLASRYRDRGIVVCERWRESFVNFLSDMGERPSPKHSLDRIDNDGNYEPTNCRWATRSQQNSNRLQLTNRGWFKAGHDLWRGRYKEPALVVAISPDLWRGHYKEMAE